MLVGVQAIPISYCTGMEKKGFFSMPLTDITLLQQDCKGQNEIIVLAAVQGQPTAQDTAFQQEQQTARVNNRMSDAATTSAAMQSFDVSSLNPTGNNVRATQQFRQQAGAGNGAAATAGAGAAAPAAALTAYAFAPAPYDPNAAPQKVQGLSIRDSHF